MQVQLRIAAALALTLSPLAVVASATVVVDNCNDSGVRSLRSVIAAVSTQFGDTVDMTQLSCSSISLTTGALTIAQQSLILEGMVSRIAVSGKSNLDDRIFKHTGYGTHRSNMSMFPTDAQRERNWSMAAVYRPPAICSFSILP